MKTPCLRPITKAALLLVEAILLCWPSFAVALASSGSPAVDEGEDEGDVADRYLDWLLEDRVTANGVAGSLIKAWQAAQRLPDASGAAAWEPLGPAPLLSSTGTRLGGRTNAIAIHPVDPNTLYAGAALGGIWKSTDRGASWTPLTDDQPSLATGSIAIDPINPEIVYAGTGEMNFSGDSYYGAGILRSTDGGASWTRLGEAELVDPNGGGARISRLLIDPMQTNVLYAATTWGLFKSVDSGQSWVNKLSSRTEAAVTDLLMHPSDPNLLYAAVSVPSSALNKGLYRSSDGGETWENLDLGLSYQQLGRIMVAQSPSDPAILYAVVGNATAGAPQMFRLKSTDGGQTWQRLADCTQNCNQSSYNSIIRVHPSNPNIVYQGAVNLYRSTDGGQTWSTRSGGHVDYHFLVYDQFENLYVGNDGGLYRINANDTLESLNNGYATIQYYAGVAVHPTNPEILLAGSQDNGSHRHETGLQWRLWCGGDGAYQAIEGLDGDPDNNWYCSSQRLFIRKSLDAGRTTQTAVDGLDRTDAAFIAPYLIDPANSNVLIAATRGIWRSDNGAALWLPNSDPTLSPTSIRSLAFDPNDSSHTYYAGSTGRIWKTTDQGANWIDLGTGLPNNVVTHIAVSPQDSNRVYATLSGFGNGHVFRSLDGGLNWTSVAGNLPDVPTSALLVEATPSATILYLGTDIGVFRSIDDGDHWDRFSNGLPNVRVEDLLVSPANGALLASTHGRGIWRLNR